MSIDVQAPELFALLLGVARAVGWLLVAPPFNTKVIPGTAKGIIAIALTLPVLPQLTGQVQPPSTPALLGLTVLQLVTGAALGFLTYLFFAVVQAAGDLVDLFGGFTVASAYDPLSMSQNSVFGRAHQLLAVTLLFATNAYQLVVRGFLSSYDAVPLTSGVDFSRLGPALVHGMTEFFVSGLQIAAPLIGVLFVADVGLGLLTRVSPALNAFSLGFPIKILLTLVLIGFTFPMLPAAVTHLSDLGVRAVAGVTGG